MTRALGRWNTLVWNPEKKRLIRRTGFKPGPRPWFCRTYAITTPPAHDACPLHVHEGFTKRLTLSAKKKKINETFLTSELTCPIFFFFSLTRPEHCWPFISSSYQASLPNVRCWLPKFDSKILITLNALQRDSRRRTPWTPAYGPFSLKKKTGAGFFMVPF